MALRYKDLNLTQLRAFCEFVRQRSFTDAARQLSAISAAGPYLIMSTVGYADGRHRVRESADPYDKDEMLSVADGIADWIATRIGASPPPASCPGGPAC